MAQLTWCLKMKLNLGFCKIRWICKLLRDLITFRLIEIETENKTTKDSRTKLEIGMKKCRQMQICGRPGTNIYISQRYLCSPTVRLNFAWYFLKDLADLMVNGGRMTLHLHACCSFSLPFVILGNSLIFVQSKKQKDKIMEKSLLRWICLNVTTNTPAQQFFIQRRIEDSYIESFATILTTKSDSLLLQSASS